MASGKHALAILTSLLLSACADAPRTAPTLDRSQRLTHEAMRTRPAAAPSLPAAPPGHYRVQPGDTLFKIAFEHGETPDDLARWNTLAEPGRIQAGQLLRVTAPRASTPTAAPANTPAASPAQSAPSKTGPADTPPPHAQPLRWTWPAQGPLLTRFGQNNSKGIQIAGQPGQPVLAAEAGRVAYAGAGLRGYGKLIIIQHDDALLSAYAHQARLLVSEGQTVRRGQQIGEVGDTDADRLKLHFEIREHGKPVDPLNHLPQQAAAPG